MNTENIVSSGDDIFSYIYRHSHTFQISKLTEDNVLLIAGKGVGKLLIFGEPNIWPANYTTTPLAGRGWISKNFLDLPILILLHCSDGEDEEGEVTIVEQGLKSSVGRQMKTVILGQPGAMQTATLSGRQR